MSPFSPVADFGRGCDKSWMALWSLWLVALFAPPMEFEHKGAQDFTQSYGVWVSQDERQCVYWLTDVGMNATQLTGALGSGYEVQRGLEILISPNTPDRCVRDAKAAATKAGFRSFERGAGPARTDYTVFRKVRSPPIAETSCE